MGCLVESGLFEPARKHMPASGASTGASEAASVMESQMLETPHGQIHVLTCGPADGEA